MMLSVVAASGDMNRIDIEVQKSKAGFIVRNKSKLDPVILSKICDDLSSKNPLVANAAMDQLTQLNDKQMLLVALSYPSPVIQIRAAKSLQAIGDKSTVPELLEVLKKANKSAIKGGSDTVSWNRDLKSELIATISKLSEVKYEGSSNYSVPEVKEFVTELERAGFSAKEKKEDGPSK